MDKPIVKYPCDWSYRVIGEDESAVKIAISEVMGNTKHTLESSNKSSGGKYLSLNLSCKVKSEGERVNIFNMLKAASVIKMVL
jgi:putative lipoic acid-binding regulatory protein